MDNFESVLFERESVFSHIEKRIQALEKGYRQNIAIIGTENCSKTPLIQSVYRTLSGRENLLVIAVSAESLGFEHFVQHWIGACLASLWNPSDPNPPEKFEEILHKTSTIAPRTAEKANHIFKMLRKQDRGHAVIKELFSLTTLLAEETHKKIVLIIDEFHALELLPVADPFSALGKEIMIEKETLYLVASSKPEKAREIFRDKFSLLFGNFEILELGSFNYQDTCNYLKRRQSGYRFSESQKKFLIHMTDGMPVYLELLLDQLGQCFPKSHATDGDQNQAVEIPNERLMIAFYKELFDDKGRLNLLFEKKLQQCRRFAKDSAPYLQALLALSEGRRKALSIATYMGIKAAEVQKILERLHQEEVIAKRGSFYLIEDNLFRYWLIEVFRRKRNLYRFSETSAKVSFLNALQHTFDKIAQESKETLVARIEMLFKEFRNDLVELNQRKLRCPHFLEVMLRPSVSYLKFPMIIAKNAFSRWLCQIATAPVHEEDVTAFKEELKRYRKKVQRTILIALQGMDQNAKLLAQEAKIQIWDFRNLNLLMDLYNLPKIITVEEIHEPHLGSLAESLSQV